LFERKAGGISIEAPGTNSLMKNQLMKYSDIIISLPHNLVFCLDNGVHFGYNPKPVVKAPGQTKITREGQPCRKCSTPVVRKVPVRKLRSDQPYYFEYYFYCPGCHAQYMVEAAKRHQRQT